MELLERAHLVVERDDDGQLGCGLAGRCRHRCWKRLGLCHRQPERIRPDAVAALLRREPQVQPAQRLRRPPVPVAEQRHQAGNEQRPDDRRVERDRNRGADAELLDERDAGGGERADRDAEEQRCGRDDPPRALHPVRNRLAVLEPTVACLLDAGEEEDRVVGREPEGGGAEEDGLGRLEAGEPSAPLEDDARGSRTPRRG